MSTSGFNFIEIIVTYIMPNFYRNHFKCNHTIGTTVCYLKCPVLWDLLFVRSFIIDNSFISGLIVILYSYNFSRMLYLLIHNCFCWSINCQSGVCFIGKIISWSDINWPENWFHMKLYNLVTFSTS